MTSWGVALAIGLAAFLLGAGWREVVWRLRMQVTDKALDTTLEAARNLNELLNRGRE